MSEREKESFMKKIIAAALFVLLVVSLLAGCTITRFPVECGIENIYLLTNTEKYRKDEEISPTPETKLTATLAKNEGEGMQFVYRPDNAKKNVRVTISDLVLDGGTEKIEDVTLYYQYYHYISQDYVTGRGKGWYPAYSDKRRLFRPEQTGHRRKHKSGLLDNLLQRQKPDSRTLQGGSDR